MGPPPIARYFLAGSMLTNAVPHFVIAVTGRRNITPFGRDSSPLVNLLWGAVNFACGCLLVSRTDRRADAGADPDAWLLPLLAGGVFWSSFGVVYELLLKGRARDRG